MKYSIAYKLPSGKWWMHENLDQASAAIMIFSLEDLGRDFRVQNQRGEVCTEGQISEILSVLPYWLAR